MKLRTYDTSKDFDEIKTWVTEKRAQYLWSGANFSYPLEKESFEQVLRKSIDEYKECHYIAITDEGDPVGFFGYSVNPETNIGKYRFVVVSPKYRGKGFGKQMMQLAVSFAFETSSADEVMLNVFANNPSAWRCYQAAGFSEYMRDENAFKFEDESWEQIKMHVMR